MFRRQPHVLDNTATATQLSFRIYSAFELKTTHGARQGEQTGTTACHRTSLLWEEDGQPGAIFPPGTSQVLRNKNPTWQVWELPWLKASWPTEPVFLVITPQTHSIQGSTGANQVTRVATFRKVQIYGFVLGTSSSPNPAAAYQESFYHKQCCLVAFYSH